jgi:gas vesicle protein
MSRRSVAFTAGLLVGSAVGVVTGLLFAPRTGRETRRILQKSIDALPELAEDMGTTVQLHSQRLADSAFHRWDDTLDRVRTAVAVGAEAAQTRHQQLQEQEQDAKRR